MDLPKHVHVTGICGVATSAIAIAFHKKSIKVTGSDKGFFPPVSTELEKQQISFYAGWHPELMLKDGKPDFVMIGGVGTSPSNPEVITAKENNIPILAYPEVLAKYFIKKNSIVVAGTWGKTTTSAMISFGLIQAGYDPSYFTGGLSLSHDTGNIGNSEWSVVEGDEYQVSISDRRPKFVYYAPTHLLLTSVSWDHADLYPTEKDYFDTFEKLVADIPKNGLILINANDPGITRIIKSAQAKIATYGHKDAMYVFHDVEPSTSGLRFTITYKDNQKTQSWQLGSPMLGRYNAENITACFAVLHQVGVPADKIIQSIKDFQGIKRRFEKRHEGHVTVIDSHAPTPDKAGSALASIREVYKGKIIAIFEPNIGGRERESASKYDNAFKNADIVIIPRLTKLKTSEENDRPMEGGELASIIQRTHGDTRYIEEDTEVVKQVSLLMQKGDVVVFLGSHGFRGMIEDTVKMMAARDTTAKNV